MLEALKQDGFREKQLHEWSKVLSDDVVEKRRSKSFTIDSAWSEIYHDLIHSPALESLLQLEHTYAVAMKDMVKQRDQALKDLTNTYVFSNVEIFILSITRTCITRTRFLVLSAHKPLSITLYYSNFP